MDANRPAGAPPLRALVPSTQFAGLGGVEAILRGHHEHDAAHGIDSRFLVFWEQEHAGWPRARFLDFRQGVTVREARRRVATAFPGFVPDVTVYHTVWGWPYFADLHGPGRRVYYVHSDTPGLDRLMRTRAWWADAFVCVSDKLAARVLDARPGVPQERIFKAEATIDVPAGIGGGPRPRESPLVVGFCGRISKEQKRVDRLPELLHLLGQAGIPVRLELLGDGPERAWLEAALPDRGRVVFHGRKSGAAYWDVVCRWDVVLFLSDYEGTPLALLECMAAGAVPLHPAISSGGDLYASRVDPMLAYPPGDMGELARRIARLRAAGDDEFDALRAGARRAIGAHVGDAYRKRFADFLRRVVAMPPLEKRPLPRRPWPMDWMTFAMTTRLGDLRRKLRPG